ncbi:MAG: hypothetical protein LBD80_08955, partial [Tannerella sp.]|nr:hypothetical protein [Tannerella sp.]
LFTKFTYYGGAGSGLAAVPVGGTLHGETVAGYGLYIKSQFDGVGTNCPEKRRATCEGCDRKSSWPTEGATSREIPEMTYIGFHDDARIHTNGQKSLLEAPVIEFFGHAEIDAHTGKDAGTKITLKTDSLIFHDSVIFDGLYRNAIELEPFTTDATQRNSDMRYGVINDRGATLGNYKDIYRDPLKLEKMGPSIVMEDRGLPVVELGYQRCTEQGETAYNAPNGKSQAGREATPRTGGDVIVAFKHDFKLPIFNTVVANNARISFLSDAYDNVSGGEYVNAFIRTDLLRIRNKVEFYTDPSIPEKRSGKFVLATPVQMDEIMNDKGIYMRHLHLEPGSELSLPDENTLTVVPTTVAGGYGHIHENVLVKEGGILAPGYSSLMESDCRTPHRQGRLTVHDLTMEQYSILRISVSDRNCRINSQGEIVDCMQTDTISVQGEIRFRGKISLAVQPEIETLADGCYLFMEYVDDEGTGAEYAKNIVLLEERHGDRYYTLDFSETGKVYLCVTKFPMPEIQRYVDLPEIDGVTFNYVKVNGEEAPHKVGRNYVKGHNDFEMNLTWNTAPLKTHAYGFYSHTDADLDATSVQESDGSVTYIIRQVVEPWTISFGPEHSTASWVGNENIAGRRLWAHRNTLYINVTKEDVVSIYSITGVLNRKVEIPSGLSRMTLDRGLYIVTLKDGKVYKIAVR